MNARPKKKLCWNCEGNVSLKAETCPYCGVSVTGLSSEISSQSPPPPYRLVNASQEDSISFASTNDQESPDIQEENHESENEAVIELSIAQEDPKRIVSILSLLLGGSVFFIFGLALLLFSEEGYLTLHWSAGNWFIYLLLAVPMLFFGFRKLNALDEPSQNNSA